MTFDELHTQLQAAMGKSGRKVQMTTDGDGMIFMAYEPAHRNEKGEMLMLHYKREASVTRDQLSDAAYIAEITELLVNAEVKKEPTKEPEKGPAVTA